MKSEVFANILKRSFGQVRDLFAKSISEATSVAGSYGIDIGTYAVKIARLEVTKDGCKVLGAAVEKIADKNYSGALSKAMTKAKVAPEQSAVISVAGQGVVSRYIELPIMNKSELDSSMKFEIEKYVPFPLGEVAADYATILEMKDKAKMSILIAAAKNELIQKKCNLAKELGISLKAVDLDCLALANFFTEIAHEGKKGACFGVVNIGKSLSSLNILVDGATYLSRDIFIGGDDITKKISEVLEVDYVEAEQLKLDPKSRKDELMGIWDPVLNNLAAEIRVSLDYFEARNNKSAEKVFITGGSSRLNGIDEYFNHALATEIKKLDYMSKLKFDPSVDQEDFKKNSDVLAVALGLALR